MGPIDHVERFVHDRREAAKWYQRVLRKAPSASGTQVRFSHRGWSEANDHYRTSCHCWALYLRILRRHLEHGEKVPHEQRLDV